MKILIFVSFLFWGHQAKSQNFFEKNVRISQSMETAEQKEEPAQFQITLPRHKDDSWLVNAGVSVKLNSKSSTVISRVATEYHRNTLTDNKQNNFQVGYVFDWMFKGGKPVVNPTLERQKTDSWFLSGDLKYVYDDVETKHTIASNLLVTLRGRGKVFAVNQYKRTGHTRYYISPFVGLQLQESFKANDSKAEGFILRPLFKFSLYYDLVKGDELTPDPKIRFSVSHTSRVDVINTTDFREDYTHLLSTGLDWFLAYKPVRVSFGGSFNYGSDPLKGLAKQQYWLLSINIYKK